MNPKAFLPFLILISGIFSASLYGQNRIIKKLERKAKQKMEQRAERKVDKAMDKGLDKLEDAIDKSTKSKKSKEENPSSSSSDTASASAEVQTAQPSISEEESSLKNEEGKELLKTSGKKAPSDPEPFEQSDFGNEPIKHAGTIGKGPYGIASGMFIQLTKTQHEMMEGSTRDTVYFDNFGQLQARFQHSQQNISMMGIKRKQENRRIAIHRNDSIYSYDPAKRKGHVMKNPTQEFYQGASEQDLKSLGQEVEQGMNTTQKRLGTERIAGKLCEVFEYTSHTESGEVLMITRMWWWRGMNLKTLSRGIGADIQQEIILLKEGISFEKSRFQPNPNISYQSFSLGNY